MKTLDQSVENGNSRTPFLGMRRGQVTYHMHYMGLSDHKVYVLMIQSDYVDEIARL